MQQREGKSSRLSCPSLGNAQKLPVTAVGTMRVKVNTIQLHRRKKKISHVPATETMNLTNVLVVSGMPCRLFSTKWGYEKDGISTHLNGDGHLRLPRAPVIPANTAHLAGPLQGHAL